MRSVACIRRRAAKMSARVWLEVGKFSAAIALAIQWSSSLISTPKCRLYAASLKLSTQASEFVIYSLQLGALLKQLS